MRLIGAILDNDRNKATYRVCAALVLAVAFANMALAARFVHEGGRWPDSWPDEMEPLRDRATTYDFSSGIEERSYVIPFEDRQEFERLWPSLLSVATPGAPITLVSGPVKYWDSETPVQAGVQIYQGRPSVGITTTKDGRREHFELKRPWPKRFFMDDGTLTAYAVFDFDNHQWVPRTSESKWKVGYRIRTDVVLIVDDDIVEWSRIELPEGVTVIDNRKSASNAAAQSQESNDGSPE